jgi:hypothetical protein
MNLRLINEHEKSNELVRTKTNLGGASSFEFVANFFSYQNAKHDTFLRHIFALETPARMALLAPRRASPGWIPGAS